MFAYVDEQEPDVVESELDPDDPDPEVSNSEVSEQEDLDEGQLAAAFLEKRILGVRDLPPVKKPKVSVTWCNFLYLTSALLSVLSVNEWLKGFN